VRNGWYPAPRQIALVRSYPVMMRQFFSKARERKAREQAEEEAKKAEPKEGEDKEANPNQPPAKAPAAAHQAAAPAPEVPDLSTPPGVLEVLRTEAALRLGSNYISKTREYFDRGVPVPEVLNAQVEAQALMAHGLNPRDPAVLDQYREAARVLPEVEREEIFFLQANDKLWRPNAPSLGAPLTGALLRPAGDTLEATTLEQELAARANTVVVASSST